MYLNNFSELELETIGRLIRHYGDLLLAQQPAHGLSDLASMQSCFQQQTEATQTAIAAELAARWPAIAFLTQTGTNQEYQVDFNKQPLCWFCEAIDGAVQYLQGLPLWTLTLSLVWQGQAEYAWVYQPSSQMMYFAQRHGGAYANQRRLHCVQRQPLQICFLASSFPNYPQRHVAEVLHFCEVLQTLIPMVFAQRWMGPASLSLAQLASGQIDGYWEIGRSLYDWLPGALLASEAGARLSDLNGASLSWQSTSVLIAQTGILSELLELYSQYREIANAQ